MRINHNIASLNTYRQLSTNSANTNKSIEKLSSGLRINRAGDDAAGLAISEKMRGQIRGLDMASKNSQDGISLIQTAEGALNETHSILQRMRELSVQASNDTNTTDDRAELQKEIDQLTSEIDRIGNTTEFNTKKLLNGGAGITTTFSAETVAGVTQNWIDVVGGTADTKADNTDIVITAATKATAATTAATTVAATTAAAHTLTINGYTVSFTGSTTVDTAGAAAAAAVNAVSDELGGITATYDAATDAFSLTSKDVGSAAQITWSASAGALTAAAITNSQAQGADATITSATLGTYTATGNTIKVTSGNYEGLELKINSTTASATGTDNDATFKITQNGSLGFQIGANQGQDMSISIADMRAEALGVNNINVTTATSAKNAITTVDDAIKKVSGERSKLGAYQNRLEHTINNLNTSSENLTAAESRVRDVDMAKEMMEQTKNSILAQAAQAMLAQANQQPQGVLQLLR
ncbi:flagellin [Paenibacillus sp. tmac-D7]|uniref:flagellin N-terminal helical domain-containing protein n=1 Tax=Paenibacillus sp. tmac-D7 TaxID=2591462 RepID=UPI0011423EB1|nr:flagellin [Paenibacillus sp. tmac-D7]